MFREPLNSAWEEYKDLPKDG
ncbi:MAG TPA: hypothetical protein PLC35_05100 [Methanosarcina vacuolata]|nr:hypothetical protein [Methanosarcina vacuolata]